MYLNLCVSPVIPEPGVFEAVDPRDGVEGCLYGKFSLVTLEDGRQFCQAGDRLTLNTDWIGGGVRAVVSSLASAAGTWVATLDSGLVPEVGIPCLLFEPMGDRLKARPEALGYVMGTLCSVNWPEVDALSRAVRQLPASLVWKRGLHAVIDLVLGKPREAGGSFLDQLEMLRSGMRDVLWNGGMPGIDEDFEAAFVAAVLDNSPRDGEARYCHLTFVDLKSALTVASLFRRNEIRARVIPGRTGLRHGVRIETRFELAEYLRTTRAERYMLHYRRRAGSLSPTRKDTPPSTEVLVTPHMWADMETFVRLTKPPRDRANQRKNWLSRLKTYESFLTARERADFEDYCRAIHEHNLTIWETANEAIDHLARKGGRGITLKQAEAIRQALLILVPRTHHPLDVADRKEMAKVASILVGDKANPRYRDFLVSGWEPCRYPPSNYCERPLYQAWLTSRVNSRIRWVRVNRVDQIELEIPTLAEWPKGAGSVVNDEGVILPCVRKPLPTVGV